jgi:hypothetical protein
VQPAMPRNASDMSGLANAVNLAAATALGSSTNSRLLRTAHVVTIETPAPNAGDTTSRREH